MSKLAHESELLEYKETLAERNAAGEDLCALANKKGGTVYFGVKNNGTVVGLSEVSEKTLRDQTQYYYDNFEPRLIMDVEAEVIDGKNVIKVVVQQSSQPFYTFKGTAYVRVGPVSKRMSQDEYHRRLLLYKSVNKDFSSTVLPEATVEDLSLTALVKLRKLLAESDRHRQNVEDLADVQLLTDLRLIQDGKLTVAAIVLLGNEAAVGKYLPYAEFRYGYKLDQTNIRNQDMAIFTGAYLDYYDQLWEKINARNITVNIPFGMQLLDRKAFDEQSIREGVNNVVIHRDYTQGESSFVMQYQTTIEIKSPGGLPEGVTVDNIIDVSKPRNKLIADVLYRCELVEQFGNGVDLMVANQLSLGKELPDFSGSDDDHVILRLEGAIQDVEFAKYVLVVADTKGKMLSDRELLLAHRIKSGVKIAETDMASALLGMGLIEKIGRGRFVLAKQYYQDMKQEAQYTRQRGLSKNKNKQLILQHLHDFGSGRREEFRAIFNPGLTENQVSVLVRELRVDGLIYRDGKATSPLSVWRLTDKGSLSVTETESEKVQVSSS